ncbi:Pickpocket protein 19 [Frankliniella fusca]|uniref:Pickpocket protein 19 n=1 Tax=Frankliniella fusca TaxID=407009 RepID=A0AAE1LQZ9_9NEOP|nr:Pickpocket protein 19 [Frankliniella fusca]
MASRPGIRLWDRALWVVVILASAAVTVRELPLTYQRLTQRPTSVDIRTTSKAVFNIPFPAVTICPKMKVRKRAAIDYLKRANQLTYVNESAVLPALQFLESFKLPYWLDYRSDGVFDDEVYELFSGIDLFHFMKTVALNCSSVFRSCLWAGKVFDCCTFFRRTWSNTGLCFAFNSYTTWARRRTCNLIPAEERPTASAASSWYLNRPKTKECGLYRALGAGPNSALEVFLEFVDPLDMVWPVRQSRGYNVAVHPANENSDMGRGFSVPEQAAGSSAMTTVSITYEETAADPWLKGLDPAARRCLFEDEIPETFRLLDQNWYTYDTCLAVCRHLFLYSRCGCLPFHTLKLGQQCSLEEYQCIVRNGRESLLWVRVTDEDLPGTTAEERNHSAWPDCRACLPPCSQSIYQTEFKTVNSVHTPNHSAAAFLNVFYRDLHSAVKYREVRDQDPAEQFVTYCSVINLFLGLSVLSVAQAAFYLARVLAELWGPARRRLARLRDRCWRPGTPSTTPSGTPSGTPSATPSGTPSTTPSSPEASAGASVPLPFVI